MVNFHGCTMPRGWSRTCPHLMAWRRCAARRATSSTRIPRAAPRHNTILPFTRNAVGPMDYTPVTFSDVTHPLLTTTAHEIALPVVFESGLLHFADSAETYRSVPPAVADVLRRVPVVWDETRFLVAEPGRCVVVARRRGEDWWVAGINGLPEPRALELDLAPLGADRWRLLSDGGDRDEIAVRDSAPVLRHVLEPRGGFVATVPR